MKKIKLMPLLMAALLMTGCAPAATETPAAAPAETAAPIQEQSPEPTPEPLPTPTPEELYAAALETLYSCDFEEALPQFEALGDYENSVNYAELCRFRIEYAKNPPESTFISRAIVDHEYEKGTMYYGNQGYFWVPKECNSETKFFMFHPGGNPGEHWLPYDKVDAYVKEKQPNAVMFFYHESGTSKFEFECKPSIDIIQDISAEKGFVAHDVIIGGASAGCFPALHGAAQYYMNYGVTVSRAFLLDAGMEWDINFAYLSEDELKTIADSGTEMYLFEQPGVRDEKEPIKNMVDAGCFVTIVECTDKQHNRIAANAFRYNVFDFAMGYIDESGLKEGEYTFVNLCPGKKAAG